LRTTFKPTEPTFQVALDVLSLTSFYQAFLISTSVLAIYMHEFWATNTYQKHYIKFKMNKKSYSFNLETFRDIFQICPKIPRQKFIDPSFKEEILSFLSNLGYLESEAYKTYYAFATGKAIPKPKYVRRSIKEKNEQAPKASSNNDGDDFVHPKFSTHDEEDKEKDSFDPRVQTPSHVETIDDEEIQVSSILDIVDTFLANKINEAIKTTVQLQSDKLRNEAQAKNEDFINKLDENIKKIIKEQVKEQVKVQVSKILLKIEKPVNKQIENEVLTHSSGDTITIKRRRDDQDEDKKPSAGSNQGSKRRRAGKEPKSTSAPKEKTSKSTGMSKEWSKSHQ
nr:hypothetical protein [Tanacetum cinerariifolium]